MSAVSSALLAVLLLFGASSAAAGMHSRRRLQGGDLPLVPPPATARESYFQNKVDHFNPSDNRTYAQRYSVDLSNRVPCGPMFLFLGGEAE